VGIFNYNPALRILDANDNPIRGATRIIFQNEGVEFAVNYADPDLINTQPAESTSDEQGYFPVSYLKDGLYRVEIRAPRTKELLFEASDISIYSGFNSQLPQVFETLQDLLDDQLLSTESQGAQLGIGTESLILVKSTGHQFRPLAAPETGQLVTEGGLQLVEAGVKYTTRARFIEAVSRGEPFSPGTSVTAGGAVFVFADDGNTDLVGLTGWKVVASDETVDAVASMKVKTDLITLSQPVNLDTMTGGGGSNIFDSVANGLAGTSDGETFTVVIAPGRQFYRNDLGVATFLGWIGDLLFDTATDVMASTETFPEGSFLGTKSGNYTYLVRPATATDHHISTAGGVKLDVIPTSGAVHVQAFGAIGDGVTDDTSAIQAAIDAGVSTVTPVGKVVFNGCCTYLVTDELVVSDTLHIDGCGARIETTMSNASKALLKVGQNAAKTYRHLIENLTLSSSTTTVSDGLKMANAGLSTLRRIYVTGFKRQLVLDGGAFDPFIGWLTVDDCYFQGGEYGIYGVGVPVNVTSIRACRFLQHTKHAIRFSDITTLTIEGNDFSFCEEGAARIASAGAVRVVGNYTEACGTGIEGNLTALFTFDDSHDIVVTGTNHFSGAFGSWRDRLHVRFGIACYSCRDVLIESNSFSYFQENPVFFDAQTGRNCRVAHNTYSTNFANPLGFPVQDLSGRVLLDDVDAEPLVARDYDRFENFVRSPREIANYWTTGAQVLAQRNFVPNAPPGDTRQLADRITLQSGGTDKSLSHTTADVTGDANKTFAIRFWLKLESVVTTAPVSGFASLELRIFDGATQLKAQHINLAQQWTFFETEFTDTNTTAHPLTIVFRPSDSVYMEFAYALTGVQLSDREAPYVYPKYSSVTHYSRESDGHSIATFPKMSVKDATVLSEDIGSGAPASGDWERGDKVWNAAPSAGSHIGWVCVTAGTPGAWKPFGGIDV